MKTSTNGRRLLRKEEGVRTKAYRDSRGIWTIGVGHTSAAGPPFVREGMEITLQEVDDILKTDLRETEDIINSLVKVPLNQNEFDALVSLVFNIGPGAFKRSSVLRLLNQGDRQGAADAFLLWKRAGADHDILLPRRNRERKLFLSHVEAPQKPVEPPPATPVPATQENWLVRLFKAILEAFRK